MRYTRPRGSQFALWPLLVLAASIGGQIGLTGAQDQFGDEEQNPMENVPPSVDSGQQRPSEENVMPLPTGKWNQFKGFYTPRPLPSNAHFTFASVWASWSAWSYCTNNIQIRVRACNTVRGFSCLGQNREVRPCEHSTLPPKRVRQFQVPINVGGIDGSPPQYEAEDPWADDRKEALRQLNSDYEGQKDQQQKEAMKKAKNQQKDSSNLEPIKLKGIGPPGIRPEAFGSKLVGRNEIVMKTGKEMTKGNEEDSLEEMNLEELAEKLEVKEPKELAEKLSELDTVDADTERVTMTSKTLEFQSTIATTKMTSTRITKMPMIRPVDYFNNKASTIIRPKPRLASPFTTSPQPPTRTTMTEPRYRPEQLELTPRGRKTILVEKEGRKGLRKSSEMEAKSMMATPQSIAEDTAKALEWIMANMSKSIESAQQQKSGSKSEEQISGKMLLHSGESMVDSREEEELTLNNNSTTKMPKIMKIRTKGGTRAMAVNSYRMTKNGEQQQRGGNQREIRMRHRQRLIKELSKAQQAKRQQIEKSREQIERAEQKGNNEKQSNEMEKELAKLRTEMRAMEAVLARMKLDARENVATTISSNSHSAEIVGSNEKTNSRQNPIVVFPSKGENKKNGIVENRREKQSSTSFEQNGNEQIGQSGEITVRIPRPSNRRIGSLKMTTMGIPKEIQATTSQSSLILTEQPESIWLAGSAPRAGAAIWSGWGDWGECICGKQMRSRHCLFEDSTFHPQGCIGNSYESRQCSSSAENCPTTIPPIPPSKQKQLIPPPNDRRHQRALNQQSLATNLRRTSLSIANPVGEEYQQRIGAQQQQHRRMQFWWIK